MTTDTYSIQVAVDSTSAVTATRNLTAMEQATGRSERALSSLGSVAKIAGSALAGISIASMAKDILRVNMEFESLRTSLETVTGSAKNAKIAFEGIQQFAAKTPYSVKEVTDAFIKMKALGLSPSEKALTSYGNTASAMGKSLKQMVEAVADAATGEFERLKEFGIKASKQGDDIKFTFKGVETKVKDSSTAITAYLQKLGDTDFAGGMERQGQTMKGTLSSLADAWDNFIDHILNDKSGGAISRWITSATSALGKFDVWLNGATTSIGKLAELQQEQNRLQASINAHNQNGVIGSLIDDLSGFDASGKQSKLAKNIEEQKRLRKELEDEKKVMVDITKAAPVSKIDEPDKKAAAKAAAEAKRAQAQATKELALAEKDYNEQINMQVAAAENAGKLFAAQQQTKIAALEAERVSIQDKAAIEYESAKTYEEKSRILNESQSATNLLLAKEKEIRDSLTNQSAETIDAKIAAAQAELDNAGKYNLTLAEQLRLKTEIAGLKVDKQVLAETTTQADIKAKSDAEQKYNDDKLASIKAISDAQTAANTAASAQMDILTANLESAKEAATGLADAFGSVGGAVGGLGVALASYEKSQAAITDGLQNQLFEIQKLNDGKGDQAKADKAIATANQKQSQLQVKSYGDMAAAAQGFFKKGTAGYNALGVATKVFRAFEMAQSAMSMVRMIADNGAKVGAYITGLFTSTAANAASVAPNVAADAAKATASGTAAVAAASAAPFPIGFATGAAMLAFMLAIGVAMAGGGSSAPTMTGAEYEQKQQDNYSASIKGSVLGSDQYSKSIVDSLDEIQSNSNADLDYSLGLLRSMEKLNNSMNALVAMTAKQLNIDIGQIQSGINFGTTKTSNSPLGSNDIVNFLAFGLLGGLFTKTTVKKEFAGAGIKFIDQTLGAIVTEGIKGAKTYVDVLVTTTKSSFFGMFKSVKQQIQTQYKSLSEDVANSLTYTIVSMYDAISTASRLTGNADIIQKLKDTTISLGKVPLGKDSSKYEEILQATMSNLADSLAELDPRFKDFQKINEGYYQTLTRVSVGINTAQTKLKAMGINAIEYTKILEKQGDVEAEMVRQSLQVASAFTDVNDIIGKLPGTADDIIEAFNGLNSIKAGLSAIGASGLTLSQDLINVAGGVSKFDNTLTDYIENYLTKTEQSAYKTGLLTDKFTQLGLVLPVMTSNAEESKASYRKLLDVLKNDTSDTGRAIYATALGMASDFASAAEDYAAIVKERTDAIKATISTYEDYRIAIYKKLGEQNPVAKEEALRLEREKSMQGMDDLTRKYTTALNQLSDAGAELTSTTTALETAYKNLTAMRDKFVTLGQGLRTYYDQLMSVGKPQATPQEIYNAAKKSFQDTAAEAAKGTESALASLPEVSKAFLEASLKYNATGDAYQADYVSVLKALEKGMSAADRQIEIMNKQLAEAEKANVNLLGVKAKTTDVDSSIALLSTAVNNFSNAMANYTLQVAKVTAVDNTIKTEIQNKQTELNQIAADNTAAIAANEAQRILREKEIQDAAIAKAAADKAAADKLATEKAKQDAINATQAAQAATEANYIAAQESKNKQNIITLTKSDLDDISKLTVLNNSNTQTSQTVVATLTAIETTQSAQAAAEQSYKAAQATLSTQKSIELTLSDMAAISGLNVISQNTAQSNQIASTKSAKYDLFGNYIGTYANGGMASGLSLVGEQGAELVNFTSPANVTSHQQTTGLFDSIGNAIDDQSTLLKEQIIELKALVNLQSSANVALINEMQGMKEELSTISRKAKLEAAA